MIRINKYLAACGVASRRKVDDLISSGKVMVNGKRAQLGLKIDPNKDKVLVDGKAVGQEERAYFLVNKPRGVVSTAADTHDRKTVVSLVKSGVRLFPVGRLDMESEGLMILTNDGELMQKLTHPKFHVAKEYEVLVKGEVGDSKLKSFAHGVKVEGGKTLSGEVEVLKKEGNTLLKLTLHEGKKRQIRLMCESLRLFILYLKRVSIGPIMLGDLKPGSFRKMSDMEVKSLKNFVK